LVVLVLACVFSSVTGGQEGKVMHLGPTDSPLAPVRYGEIQVNGRILETLPPLYVVKPDADTIYGLAQRFEQARKDKSLRGVVVKLDHMEAGWGKAEELRRQMLKCREAGKEIVCFLQSGGNLEYYVASAADRIVMRPSSSLMLLGLRAEVMFLKNLFDKIGVEAEMIQVGKYKGAAEPMTRVTSSDPFQEVLNALLDDMYGRLVENIAAGREMSVEDVKRLVDQGPYTGRRAREVQLVDSLMFYDEALRQIQEREEGPFELVREYGKDEQLEPPLGAGPKELMKMIFGMGQKIQDDGFPSGPTIAILYAVGPIVREDPDQILVGESVINAHRMVRYIGKLRDRDNVRAIVVRIDSSGGSAEASDMIWRALRRADEEKPVVASISDVGASGGYYIATGARHIYADNGSLTGSIGVVGGKLVLSGLFEKIGVTVDVFQRGRNSGLFSSVETFSKSQRETFRGLLEETYRIFLQRIMASRKLSTEQLERWAQGRPLTGNQALEGHLIDEVGGLEAALKKARQEAGIPPETDIAIVRVPKAENLLKVLFWGRDPGVKLPRDLQSPFGHLPRSAQPLLRYIQTAARVMVDHQAAALMPVHISIR
jgi:protease-4